MSSTALDLGEVVRGDDPLDRQAALRVQRAPGPGSAHWVSAEPIVTPTTAGRGACVHVDRHRRAEGGAPDEGEDAAGGQGRRCRPRSPRVRRLRRASGRRRARR